jgi:hypothetical protein
MRSPVLPIHFQISGNGAQAAGSTLTAICATVSLEGPEPIGRGRAASSGAAEIICTTNWTIIKAIRIKAGNRSTRPRNISVTMTNTDTNATAEYCLIQNPTVAGGSLSWSDVSNSKMEEASGNASLYASAGTPMILGYVAGRTADGSNALSRITMGFSIGGTPRALALCARIIAGSPNLHGAINWVEV